MPNSTCASACKLTSKINFLTPRTCEEQSFYGKRCFNPCCLNGLDLGRDETSYMSNRSLICTRSAGYINQSQKHCHLLNISLNSRYILHTTNTLPNATAMSALALERIKVTQVKEMWWRERAAQSDSLEPHNARGQDHVDKGLRHYKRWM